MGTNAGFAGATGRLGVRRLVSLFLGRIDLSFILAMPPGLARRSFLVSLESLVKYGDFVRHYAVYACGAGMHCHI